jgi:hypothetical protein
MLLDQPTGLSEAVKVLLAKDLMPTSLDTAGLRELDASLRAQSLFSAETTNKYLIGKYRDLLTNILQPSIAVPGGSRPTYNPTYAKEEIKNFLAGISYTAPEGTEGTIKDLSSDARIDLVIKTNTEMAQGQGWWLQGQDAAILDGWPGQELFRAEGRKVPRDWIERWRLAGSQTGDPMGTGWTIAPDERLIALKNHAIWNLIGSSKLFPDGLDQPWPPFAFQSGMWVRDVTRAETESLGLITADQVVEPMSVQEALA